MEAVTVIRAEHAEWYSQLGKMVQVGIGLINIKKEAKRWEPMLYIWVSNPE